MKKMLLQELMYLAVVVKLITTPLKMLGPVKTSILNLRWKTFINSATLYVSHKRTGRGHATYILPKRGGHQPYTPIG